MVNMENFVLGKIVYCSIVFLLLMSCSTIRQQHVLIYTNKDAKEARIDFENMERQLHPWQMDPDDLMENDTIESEGEMRVHRFTNPLIVSEDLEFYGPFFLPILPSIDVVNHYITILIDLDIKAKDSIIELNPYDFEIAFNGARKYNRQSQYIINEELTGELNYHILNISIYPQDRRIVFSDSNGVVYEIQHKDNIKCFRISKNYGFNDRFKESDLNLFSSIKYNGTVFKSNKTFKNISRYRYRWLDDSINPQ